MSSTSKVQADKRYNAEIVAGDLLLAETRVLADLIARGTTPTEIARRIRSENVLQKRTIATGVREGRLITNRLDLADGELIALILNDNRQVAVQAALVLAIQHSRLIGDFLRRVVKERWRVFEAHLRPNDWEDFLTECEQFDPAVRQWKPVTRAKLGQVVKRILVQAGYLQGKKNHQIIPVLLVPEIRDYLIKRDRLDILESMNVTL